MLHNKDFVHLSGITKAHARELYPEIIKHQDYGYVGLCNYLGMLSKKYRFSVKCNHLEQ
jgi:hypothetical protein